MNKLITALCVLYSLASAAQPVHVYNQNVEITIADPGFVLYLPGNLTNAGDSARYANAGTIRIAGNINHLAPANSMFVTDKGTVMTVGNQAQTFASPSIPLNLFSLRMAKSGGVLTLPGEVQLKDTLHFVTGTINLGGRLQLGPGGYLHKESSASHITGAGYVQGTYLINNPDTAYNPGGMGLRLRSSHSYGFVTLERRHTSVANAGEGSIKRSYAWLPEFEGPADIIALDYFPELILPATSHTSLQLWKGTESGDTWRRKGGTADSLANVLVFADSSLQLNRSYLSLAPGQCLTPPPLNFQDDTVYFCRFDTAVLDAQLPGHQYLWNTGDTGQTASVNSSGMYSLLVTSPSGCIAEDSLYAREKPLPEADFLLVPACGSLAASFTNLSTISEDSLTYEWDLAGLAVSDLTHPSASFDEHGIYTIELTARSPYGCTDRVNYPLDLSNPFTGLEAGFLVHSAPYVGDTIQFVQLSTPEPRNFIWNFGDGTTPTYDRAPSHVYTTEAEFTVSLIAQTDECADTLYKTVKVTMKPASGEKAEEGDSTAVYAPVHITAFPIPAREYVNFKIESDANLENLPVAVELYDINGKILQKIQSQITDKHLHTMKVATAGIAPGSYFMRVKLGSMQQSIRIAKN